MLDVTLSTNVPSISKMQPKNIVVTRRIFNNSTRNGAFHYFRIRLDDDCTQMRLPPL
jgi:hypothetical protein